MAYLANSSFIFPPQSPDNFLKTRLRKQCAFQKQKVKWTRRDTITLSAVILNSNACIELKIWKGHSPYPYEFTRMPFLQILFFLILFFFLFSSRLIQDPTTQIKPKLLLLFKKNCLKQTKNGFGFRTPYLYYMRNGTRTCLTAKRYGFPLFQL